MAAPWRAFPLVQSLLISGGCSPSYVLRGIPIDRPGYHLQLRGCVEERRCGDHRQRPRQSIAGFFQFCTVLDTAATIIPGDISRTSLCDRVATDHVELCTNFLIS